jgi:dipeptidase E
MSRPRQILALGGGGFSMEAGNALLDDHALALTAVECPKVCFLPTASGDADHYIVRFYRAFPAGRCQPSHISLFRRDGGATNLAAHLMGQDLIYVGGGSLISLLGTWTAHGIDLMLRAAWQNGVVMAGLSAGSLCWFDHAITAFHGESRRVKGLGFVPTPMPSTTTRSRNDARRSSRRSPTACRPATAPATAQRSTSSTRTWPAWSRRAPTPGLTMSRLMVLT